VEEEVVKSLEMASKLLVMMLLLVSQEKKKEEEENKKKKRNTLTHRFSVLDLFAHMENYVLQL
jgi:hypothetical protein